MAATQACWVKLTATASRPVLEALSSLLVDWGAAGTVEVPSGVSAYYPPDSTEAIEANLARYAADLREPLTWAWAEVPAEDWWESWKAFFKPTVVSPRLAVCPSWETSSWSPADAAVRTIRMDPGRAFGTGTHETTQLCLRLLDECIGEQPPSTLLDVGCGSGILTIGARLLGVPRAIALDVDPVATEACRENVVRNGVVAGTLVLCADLRALRGSYPLVVANILYQVLLGLAPALSERVANGGRLLLSGMLAAELPSAENVYGRLELATERREVFGEWGALVLRREG